MTSYVRSESPHPFDQLTIETLRQRRSVKWRRYDPDVLPCWVAEMDYPLADPIRAVLSELVERHDTGYADFDGLADAFAEFSARRLGVRVDPESVYPVPDVMVGIHVSLELFTAPADGVVVCPPVYPPFYSTIPYAGRRVVEAPLAYDSASSRYDLDLDAIERALRTGARALLLCNPHNPVGRAWSRADLEAVAELAERHDAVVLSDEVHGPLTYDDSRFTAFGSLDTPAVRRSVTLTSASKAFNLPGLKCAVVVAGSPEMRKVFDVLPDEVPLGTSIFGVAANIAAFRDGDAWLDSTTGYLQHNRDLLGALIAERLPTVRWSPPAATFLGWLDFAGAQLGNEPADAILERARVALYPGERFGTGGGGFARLNFATTSAVLTQAVDRMAAALT
ncbi:MAG: aminotransferase class I/II-fold pyridoxal phosphate-dependent enzyme [Propionibacteriales bacterium]|nr:aminotransferase class I/II-fold pyridoxal phosphate-dependent enzyme [Propionibacteriales bacterium]